MSDQPEKPSKIVLSMGSSWSQLFDSSLARHLAGITHLPLGSPRFVLDLKTFALLTKEEKRTEGEATDLYKRLNSKNRQASELSFRLEWFVKHSDFVLIDTGLLDTAVGHHVIVAAHVGGKRCYGVGVDDRSSPLAPIFIRGIIYPSSPDDLVKLVLDESL